MGETMTESQQEWKGSAIKRDEDWQSYLANVLTKIPFGNTVMAQSIAELAFHAGWDAGYYQARERIKQAFIQGDKS